MVDQLIMVRIGLVLLIALVYMLFDIFNKRNVPTIYAIATVAIGVVFTYMYNPDTITMSESFIIAIVVGGLGYFLYKIGQIGGADVTEMVAISMILPIQPAPYLISSYQLPAQLPLPFVISVFLAAGVIALMLIPAFYLPRAQRILKKKLFQMIEKKDVMKGVFITLAYAAFMAFAVYHIGVGTMGVVVLVVIMISSLVTAVFERPITDSMVEYIPVKKFEEGDIIALNLMSAKEISAAKKKVKLFDRLVTIELMQAMKKARIKGKFPVYRSAMPLALPLFLGVVISLLIGNILLLIL